MEMRLGSVPSDHGGFDDLAGTSPCPGTVEIEPGWPGWQRGGGGGHKEEQEQAEGEQEEQEEGQQKQAPQGQSALRDGPQGTSCFAQEARLRRQGYAPHGQGQAGRGGQTSRGSIAARFIHTQVGGTLRRQLLGLSPPMVRRRLHAVPIQQEFPRPCCGPIGSVVPLLSPCEHGLRPLGATKTEHAQQKRGALPARCLIGRGVHVARPSRHALWEHLGREGEMVRRRG
mmetsp:Transcript_66709/g.193188  ORF Transcript_66709/g.193188 Transcript_66709/m.193188 type:complete len:228 (-) Transcript_66709:435-1118(-)